MSIRKTTLYKTIIYVCGFIYWMVVTIYLTKSKTVTILLIFQWMVVLCYQHFFSKCFKIHHLQWTSNFLRPLYLKDGKHCKTQRSILLIHCKLSVALWCCPKIKTHSIYLFLFYYQTFKTTCSLLPSLSMNTSLWLKHWQYSKKIRFFHIQSHYS